MAKLKYGLLGMFSGSVGDVVGVIRNGKQIVRAKPKKSTKKPSVAQVVQRTKFKVVTSFLKPLKPWIDKYYCENKKGITPMNLAMSYHLKEALVSEEHHPTIDFQKVVITRGILCQIAITKVSLVKNKLAIHWKKGVLDLYSAMGSDMLTLMVYSISTDSFQVFENVATRDAQKAIIHLPASHREQDNAVWFFMVKQDETMWSTSMYLGVV